MRMKEVIDPFSFLRRYSRVSIQRIRSIPHTFEMWHKQSQLFDHRGFLLSIEALLYYTITQDPLNRGFSVEL